VLRALTIPKNFSPQIIGLSANSVARCTDFPPKLRNKPGYREALCLRIHVGWARPTILARHFSYHRSLRFLSVCLSLGIRFHPAFFPLWDRFCTALYPDSARFVPAFFPHRFSQLMVFKCLTNLPPPPNYPFLLLPATSLSRGTPKHGEKKGLVRRRNGGRFHSPQTTTNLSNTITCQKLRGQQRIFSRTCEKPPLLRCSNLNISYFTIQSICPS